jgi:hypothetical protein
MFDYEILQGLGGFRDVRLEPLPSSEENNQPMFRTAYSGTKTGIHTYNNHIEGVVLLIPNEETRDIRQIHLFKSAWL